MAASIEVVQRPMIKNLDTGAAENDISAQSSRRRFDRDVKIKFNYLAISSTSRSSSPPSSLRQLTAWIDD